MSVNTTLVSATGSLKSVNSNETKSLNKIKTNYKRKQPVEIEEPDEN